VLPAAARLRFGDSCSTIFVVDPYRSRDVVVTSSHTVRPTLTW
jgi:hypothetical protein